MGLENPLAGLRRSTPTQLADALTRLHVENRARHDRVPPSPVGQPDGQPAASYGLVRKLAGWLEELHRIQGKLVDLVVGVPPDPRPADELDETLLSLMRRAARLVLKYPVAMQSAFAALVAEGRAFAGTEEGARYEAALRRSPAIERSFRVFEMLTSNLLLENRDLVLPSAYLDLLVQASEVRNLGPYFASLLSEER